MTKIFLTGFKAGKSRYEHTVESETSETFIHVSDTDLRIYNTNAGGWVYNKAGLIAGRFRRMNSGCWFYQTIDASTRLNTKFKDLLEAQRDVFSVLLGFGFKD